MSATYHQVPAAGVPQNIVWTTPHRHQGQIVETSYSRGIPAGQTQDMEADHGDPWMRVIDHSDGQTAYYRLDPLTLSAQDMAVLRKMARNPGLETSLSHSGWQPTERNLQVVQSLIERGVLEQRPGFSSVQWTDAGYDAYLDKIEQR